MSLISVGREKKRTAKVAFVYHIHRQEMRSLIINHFIRSMPTSFRLIALRSENIDYRTYKDRLQSSIPNLNSLRYLEAGGIYQSLNVEWKIAMYNI